MKARLRQVAVVAAVFAAGFITGWRWRPQVIVMPVEKTAYILMPQQEADIDSEVR